MKAILSFLISIYIFVAVSNFSTRVRQANLSAGNITGENVIETKNVQQIWPQYFWVNPKNLPNVTDLGNLTDNYSVFKNWEDNLLECDKKRQLIASQSSITLNWFWTLEKIENKDAYIFISFCGGLIGNTDQNIITCNIQAENPINFQLLLTKLICP